MSARWQGSAAVTTGKDRAAPTVPGRQQRPWKLRLGLARCRARPVRARPCMRQGTGFGGLPPCIEPHLWTRLTSSSLYGEPWQAHGSRLMAHSSPWLPIAANLRRGHGSVKSLPEGTPKALLTGSARAGQYRSGSQGAASAKLCIWRTIYVPGDPGSSLFAPADRRLARRSGSPSGSGGEAAASAARAARPGRLEDVKKVLTGARVWQCPAPLDVRHSGST